MSLSYLLPEMYPVTVMYLDRVTVYSYHGSSDGLFLNFCGTSHTHFDTFHLGLSQCLFLPAGGM